MPLTRNTEEAAQVVVEARTEWAEAEVELRMASAAAAAEPRTDSAGAEVHVALAAAESRMPWAAEESLTA